MSDADKMENAVAALMEGAGVDSLVDQLQDDLNSAQSCETVTDLIANLDAAAGRIAMLQIQVKAAMRAAKGKV